MQLDSADSLYLENIANSSNGDAKIMAENILSAAFGKEYCNCVHGPQTNLFASRPDGEDSNSFEDKEDWLTVSPNPASVWIAFDYAMPIANQSIVVNISDEEGKQIQSFKFTDKIGQKVWDIRSLSKGIYFYEARSGDKSISGKIIIQ